jgi:hypothetical protein
MKVMYGQQQVVSQKQFHEQNNNSSPIQALAAFFGGGGKYIGDPVELSGLTSCDCGDGYWG